MNEPNTTTDDTNPIDLGPLFDTPQIYTDEHGAHRDAEGREHDAVTVGGELAFTPTPAPAPTGREDLLATLRADYAARQASPLMQASRILGALADRCPSDFRWTDVTVDQHGTVLIVAASWPAAFDAAAHLQLVPGNPVPLGPSDEQGRAVMIWSGTVSDVRVDISVTYRPSDSIRQSDGAARSFVTENLESLR